MFDIDISYYNTMIDMMEENKKINEEIFGSKYMQCLTESNKLYAIYESKITDSILNFFKKIFDKVIEFFKKLVSVISDIKNFSVNKKLLSEVENRLKNMSADEKKSISLDIELNTINKNDQYLDYLLDKSEDGIKYLEEIVYNIKDLMYKDISVEDIESELEKYDVELEEPTKSKLVIKYNDLKEVISQYENMYTRVRSLRKQLQADQMNMNNYKKTIDSLIKRNTTKDNSAALNKYKELVTKICSGIIKINKEIIKEMQYSFRVYEKVLRFLAPEKDSKNNENISEEVIDAVNKKDKLLLKIMLKDSLLTDKTFKDFESTIRYINKHLGDIYEEHDGEQFTNDTSLYTIDLMNEQMVNVVSNFSRERIAFLKKLVTHIYKK